MPPPLDAQSAYGRHTCFLFFRCLFCLCGVFCISAPSFRSSSLCAPHRGSCSRTLSYASRTLLKSSWFPWTLQDWFPSSFSWLLLTQHPWFSRWLLNAYTNEDYITLKTLKTMWMKAIICSWGTNKLAKYQLISQQYIKHLTFERWGLTTWMNSFNAFR